MSFATGEKVRLVGFNSGEDYDGRFSIGQVFTIESDCCGDGSHYMVEEDAEFFLWAEDIAGLKAVNVGDVVELTNNRWKVIGFEDGDPLIVHEDRTPGYEDQPADIVAERHEIRVIDPAPRPEAVEPTPKFQIGDRVQSNAWGESSEVTRITDSRYPEYGPFYYYFGDYNSDWENNLELAPAAPKVIHVYDNVNGGFKPGDIYRKEQWDGEWHYIAGESWL